MANKLMTLDEVIGQANVVKWFTGCIKRNSLPQVVLLTGAPGIGKSSIAKIVACEIAYKNKPSELENAKQSVIVNDKSTDCVRLYNMSNLKSQDAVLEVKSDLNIGFSSTGRKVIIMDEAHGMSNEAQDALLTTFESLPSGIFVIVCSTEVESFRDAFLSRCVRQILRNLSASEMRQFLKKRILENQLKFDVRTDMLLSMLSAYTGREPRRAINLLDSFEAGSTISISDLDSFFNINQGKQLVTLIDYMYDGSIMQGLDFVNDMDIDNTFVESLLEILRMSQGGSMTILPKDAYLHIQELIAKMGVERLLGFTIDCSTTYKLTKNKVAGFYLRQCAKSVIKPIKAQAEEVQVQDLKVMSTMMETSEVNIPNAGSPSLGLSLEQLLSESETIE